jgi:hypothetical protein
MGGGGGGEELNKYCKTDGARNNRYIELGGVFVETPARDELKRGGGDAGQVGFNLEWGERV